jgi:hypothetical protein
MEADSPASSYYDNNSNDDLYFPFTSVINDIHAPFCLLVSAILDAGK